MDKSKPFGLIIPKKSGTFRPKICNAFESDSDEDKTPKRNSAKIPQSKPISVKTEDLDDPSIYEYDTIYDDMKAQKAAEIKPKVKKSSRYIDHLLKAADKRKKEYERRVERKVQLEREKEGDKFEDKEMFVSASYKKKLQEREEEEERERRENQLNDMMDVTKQKDLSGFYRHFLKQSVGEEKIPVFGERHAVKRESDQEKKAAVSIKEEPLSESDNEHSSSTAALDSKLDHSALDKDFGDSDDSSSGGESENEAENSYERSQRVPNDLEKKDKSASSDEKSDEGNSSDKSVKLFPTKKLVKEHSAVSKSTDSKKRTKSFSDEVNINLSKPSKISKQNRSNEKLESVENVEVMEQDLDSEQELSETNDEIIKNSDGNPSSKNGISPVDNNKERVKRNIYEKRAVGDLFAAAQARYFQRLASRTAV